MKGHDATMYSWKRYALAALMPLLLSAATAAQTVTSYHETYPGQSLSMHKPGPGGPAVYIHGFSSAVPDSAFSPAGNPYGRYQSYGAVLTSGAHPPAGWDYARWPGTTAIRMSAEELAADAREPINGQRFAGGSYLGDGIGVFAMQFHDAVFDRSFWFNKTVFCFNNKVVCLGSDIENHNYERVTETTLYQAPLTGPDMPTFANSMRPLRQVPDSETFPEDAPVWLVDPAGTGYVLPSGKGLHAVRQQQFPPADSGRPEAGDFAVAWIDHGIRPYQGAYEYTILFGESLGAIAAYAQAPEHTVLQQNKYGHIVRYNPLNLTAYVMFRREEYCKIGPVAAINMPCIVMVQEDGNTMRVSVCEPAPEALEAEAKEAEHGAVPGGITLKLHGKWVLAGPQEHVRATDLRPDMSTFVFACADGLPTETLLRRKP